MGNDGGSIPKRRELVKESARAPTASELKANALESQTHAWSVCPITSATLDPTNTVSDARGRLYNYESVLQCLMPGATDGADADASGRTEAQMAEFAATGIKSLRDIVKLKFSLQKRKTASNGNGGETSAVTSTGGSVVRPAEESVPVCPISMKELGPGTRSVYIVPCGHTFAGIAMKEIAVASAGAEENGGKKADNNGDETSNSNSSGNDKTQECPECSEPFVAPRDLIPILSADESDVERLAKRAEDLAAQGLTHSLKKDKSSSKKKRKAAAAATAGEDQSSSGKSTPATKNGKSGGGGGGGDISSRINNSATASLTAKVLAEQEQNNKRRKMVAATGAVR